MGDFSNILRRNLARREDTQKSSWRIKTNEVGVLFYKTSKHLLWNGRNPLTPWKTLALEKKVNEALLAMHVAASEKNDAHLADFLEAEFLDEQVEAIKKLAMLVCKLKRLGGEGLGLYQFNLHSMK